MRKKNKKILVAMSGGVDSSVSALLLKQQGFDVQAVYFVMQNEKNKHEKVAKIAKKIGIPLETKNIVKNFQKEVIDCFIKEYQQNRTPNPCVVCNPRLKFSALLEAADGQNIKYVATGHYARVRKSKVEDKFVYKLLKARDKSKDQSYFLYRLKRKQLARIIFPLGEREKEAVEKIAKRFDLPVEETESQDICFFREDSSLKQFLEKRYGKKRGEIIDEDGNVLGNHDGYLYHTIGQRQGLGLSGGPFYVIRKDPIHNHITVVNNRDHELLWSGAIEITKPNWIGGEPRAEKAYEIKTRYQAKPSRGILGKKGKKWIANLSEPQWAVAPGQSLVVFSGDEVVGGGFIEKAGKNPPRRVDGDRRFPL